MDQSKQNNGLTDEQFMHPKSVSFPEDFTLMKIYLLKRIFSVGWDEYDGKVIIASSAKAARKIANLRVGEEGQIWDNPKLVLCQEIDLTMPMVVLTSFKNG